ncbi:MAG: transposase [Ardenticatenaceae bacterium]|nr:transposase [Ardenticatenaceae bacterium]
MCREEYQRELNRKNLPTVWEVPESTWCCVRQVLPPEKLPGTPGRPVVAFQGMLNGILSVLRTGCQWKTVPLRYDCGSPVHYVCQPKNDPHDRRKVPHFGL